MRNNWGLWDKDSDLHKYFLSIGIWHADDASGIISESFARQLRGEPINLEEQVQHYKDYWKNMEDNTVTEVLIDNKAAKVISFIWGKKK